MRLQSDIQRMMEVEEVAQPEVFGAFNLLARDKELDHDKSAVAAREYE